MQAVYASLVAVFGTLLGAVTTYAFQHRAAESATRSSRADRLREERLATYSAFAEAVTDYRSSQYRRWELMQLDPGSPESTAATLESHRLRCVTRQIRWRIQLLTDDQELVRLADTAVIEARDMGSADDVTDRKRRHDLTGVAVEHFVLHAATHVR
ncbi:MULTISPECIES: hypothetical protein [unclassified Streptomyces]|uniref:hypothetical protein n=1 Tax=unclassified Streptomyces TaxID=2593676 RepID=UPI003649B2B8